MAWSREGEADLQWRPQNTGDASNGMFSKKNCRREVELAQERVYAYSRHKNQRTAATQGSCRSHDAVKSLRSRTWKYRIWCLPCCDLVVPWLSLAFFLLNLPFLEWECFLHDIVYKKYMTCRLDFYRRSQIRDFSNLTRECIYTSEFLELLRYWRLLEMN